MFESQINEKKFTLEGTVSVSFFPYLNNKY